jgi:alginate O-acetyltransferase complex protein AlgI
MMFEFYYDVKFWLFCAAAVVIYRLLGPKKHLRGIFLALCSAFMLLALPRFNLYSLGFVVLCSSLVFFTSRAIQRLMGTGHDVGRIALAMGCIVVLVLQLVFFKYQVVQTALTRAILRHPDPSGDMVFVLGVSYFSFKMIHFVVECYKGGITTSTYLDFLNYVLFFPAFISGPIARYGNFRDELAKAAEADLREDLREAVLRIINGLFKKLVLTMILYKYTFMSPDLDPTNLSLWSAIATMYLSTLYFYLDFSAYSDVAIGAARAMGIKLPENFNKPFLKQNIQKLWTSWHMSLTQWLTDYIYWPLCRKLRKRALFAARPVLLSSVSILVTFLICGLWHGDTIAFVLWGLYHGVGLSILNVYQKLKRRARSDFLRRYFTSKLSRVVGVFLTFNFFAFGMLFFFTDVISLDVIRSWL